MSVSDVWQIALALIGAGAVYGGIRADLRGMHERVAAVHDLAAKAHARIDDCMMGGARER